MIETAVRTCLICGNVLTNDQELTCSSICNGRRVGIQNRKPIESRFWKYLRITDTGCWEWQRGLSEQGYGKLYWNGERYTHRIVWILCWGDIPEGLCVCHHCDNPPCCNPLHLFLGTDADNLDDMRKKGRWWVPVGEDSAPAKMKTVQILDIIRRREEGVPVKVLAEEFSLNPSTISKIALRKRWKHLSPKISVGS